MARALLRTAWLLGVGAAAIGCDDGGGLVQVTAQIEVTPNPILVPDTPLGLIQRTRVTIRSTGDLRLDIEAIGIEGGRDLTVEAPALPLSIEARAETAVDVVYTPTAPGTAPASLWIRSNADADLRIPIEARPATGPVALLCLSSPGLNLTERCFGDDGELALGVFPIGAAVTATVTVKSVGDQPVALDNLALAAGVSPEFQLAALTTPFSLAPGEERRRVLRYEPTAAGDHQAKITLQGSSPGLPSLKVTARAIPAALCADPTSLDFGGVVIGQSTVKSLRLSACGGSPVTVQGLAIEGTAPFALSAPPTGPVPLQPVSGLGLTVDVQFSPTTVGRAEGVLVVNSDAGPLRISLRGSSGACDLKATPTALFFSAGIAQRTFLLENTGARECQVTGLGLGAGSDPSFSLIAPPSLPLRLAPGESQAVNVDHQETGTLATGVVQIDYTADGTPGTLTIDLEASNLPDPTDCRLEVAPGAITFGVVPLDTTLARTITVTNVGTGNCELQSFDLVPGSSPAFQFERFGGMSRLGNLTIGPGELMAGVVRFRSSVVASESATLRIDRLDPTATDVDVPLSASTNGTLLCVSPGRVDFGNVSSGNAVVALTACGTAPVTISTLALQPNAPEVTFTAPSALPLTISTGQTVNLSLNYAPIDSLGDVTELVIGSDDAGRPEQRVLVTGGANVPELCGNGLDEDGDQFIDEDCVPDPAIGRAVVLDQGRLFVWGDEHVKISSYGRLPAPFWRGVFGWLTCADCPGPRRTRIGDLNAFLNPLMAAEASALGLQVVNVSGGSSAELANVDALLILANNVGFLPDLEPWVRQGGAVMIMAVGIGPGECSDSLDVVLAPFPLRYDCSDPNPWGPVSQFYPHPITQSVAPIDAPFVNGRFVTELPGTHSTVIAVP